MSDDDDGIELFVSYFRSQLDGVLSQFQDSQEDRTASWEDVLDRIERSREEYEAKASRSSTRGRARTSEEAARVLASITDMIPDEKGLSVLRCGLSLVFRVGVEGFDSAHLSINKIRRHGSTD